MEPGSDSESEKSDVPTIFGRLDLLIQKLDEVILSTHSLNINMVNSGPTMNHKDDSSSNHRSNEDSSESECFSSSSTGYSSSTPTRPPKTEDRRSCQKKNSSFSNNSSLISSEKKKSASSASSKKLSERNVVTFKNDVLPTDHSSSSFQIGMSEEDCWSLLSEEHKGVKPILAKRQSQILILKNLWNSKGPKLTVDRAVALGHQDVLVDLLSVICRPDHQSIWNLDICQIVLQSLGGILRSKHEDHVLVGCSVLKLVLTNFGGIIKNNIEKLPHPKDISGSERYAKSLECFQQIKTFYPIILGRRKTEGAVGHKIRELEFILLNLD